MVAPDSGRWESVASAFVRWYELSSKQYFAEYAGRWRPGGGGVFGRAGLFFRPENLRLVAEGPLLIHQVERAVACVCDRSPWTVSYDVCRQPMLVDRRLGGPLDRHDVKRVCVELAHGLLQPGYVGVAGDALSIWYEIAQCEERYKSLDDPESEHEQLARRADTLRQRYERLWVDWLASNQATP